jgi:pyruvate dehydrogenase E2 component (dihydrolipoamide acetyltransferase)
MAAPQSTGNPDNVTPILMPQAGQSMEEGTILGWKVAEGDVIEVGQIIMEIETDKATMEVEAVDAGRVAKIIAQEGAIVEVKKPVALIAASDDDANAFLSGEGVPTPAAASSPAPAAAPAQAQSAPTPVEPADPVPTASAPEGAVVPVLMPQAGQSMEEGTILAWKVAEGDVIEVGQIIMEIETDKATMEVEAVDAGRVAKIVAQEGAIVEVKKPVAYLAEADVDIDACVGSAGDSSPAAPAAATPAKTAAAAVQKAPASVSQSGRVKASPAARKAAKEKGLDLASVPTGSGPGGRVLSTDVEQADVIPTETNVHPLTKMRKAIANNLSYSKQNVPHFYAKNTIDAGPLFATYRKTKQQFKCSVNDFVTCACAKAVRQYPGFRSQFNETEVIEKPSVNIGIAVGTDEGLTVPVVLVAPVKSSNRPVTASLKAWVRASLRSPISACLDWMSLPRSSIRRNQRFWLWVP